MRYFHVSTPLLNQEKPVLSGPEAHHMIRVLRLKPGQRVRLGNGQGMACDAEVEHIEHEQVRFTVLDRFPATGDSPLHLTVGQSMLKDRKMDGLVRQLTELGVSRWIPFFSHHSVPTPDGERLARRHGRWFKIAREALKQCHRGCLPDIGQPVSFSEILSLTSPGDLKIIFWEQARRPLPWSLAGPGDPRTQRVFVLLGPEGGFAQQEVSAAESAGFVPVSLGPRILRAETATLAAVTLVQATYGDMGWGEGDPK